MDRQQLTAATTRFKELGELAQKHSLEPPQLNEAKELLSQLREEAKRPLPAYKASLLSKVFAKVSYDYRIKKDIERLTIENEALLIYLASQQVSVYKPAIQAEEKRLQEKAKRRKQSLL
jgi:hypothetical protein